jgi:hypothetical protein
VGKIPLAQRTRLRKAEQVVRLGANGADFSTEPYAQSYSRKLTHAAHEKSLFASIVGWSVSRMMPVAVFCMQSKEELRSFEYQGAARRFR